MTIRIIHGIYNIVEDTQFDRVGSWEEESKTYFSINSKFKQFLARKGKKFHKEYGANYIQFTLGIDKHHHIDVITICQPYFDNFDYEMGEKIVVGRIKRARGDLKEIIYEKEKFKKKIKLFDVKDEDGEVVETVYNIIVRKRVILDLDNNPIVKRKIYYKPYDLNEKYPDIEHKDGSITYGELRHPYIHIYD